MVTTTTPNGYYQNHISKYTRDGSPRTYLTNPGWTVLPSNVVTGGSIPDYKVAIAKKQNATGGYTRTVIKANPRVSSTCYFSPLPNLPWWETQISGSDFWRWVPDGLTLITPVEDNVLKDQALARIKRKLASNTGQFKAMVPLAEIGELRGSIRKAAGLASSTLKALIEIRRTKGRSASKHAADTWLNFNFGIAPVLKDIESAATAIEYILYAQSRNLVLKGTASKTWKTSSRSTNVSANYLSSATVAYEFQHELLYSYTAGFFIDAVSGNDYGVLKHLGFEPVELPSVGWELIPYSWVVDYFTTTGAFLSDMFTSPPGQTIYVSEAAKYTCKATASWSYPVKSDSLCKMDSATPGICDYEYVNFRRTPLGQLPHLDLRFKTVDEIGLNSITKVINLASVLLK